MRLRDITPAEVAQQTHDALLERLGTIAGWCGVTDTMQPHRVPSPAHRAVHQLALYATTGVPPECRPELIAEYAADVSHYAEALGELTSLQKPETPLQVVLSAAVARQALAADEHVTSAQVAVLASLTPGRMSQLQSAGDAPKGRKVRGRQQRRIPADEARAWLGGRGVPGFAGR